MNSLFITWTLLALLFLLFETSSPGLFYFLAFSFGSLVAGIGSIAYGSLVIQGLLFLVGTCGSLVLLKYWVAKKSKRYYSHERSNIYALQGKRIKVITPISITDPGTVKIGGELWVARANYDISAGTLVVVVEVRGAHVIVEEVQSN